MRDGRLQCLDLFSGCGGISIALQPYCQTVAYCDTSVHCQKIIAERIKEGRLEDAPIFGDVRSLSPDSMAASGVATSEITIISAGFPCQDISTAGRQMGVLGDTRSSLWRQVVRLARACESVEWLFLENVAAILTLQEKGITPVLSDLSEAGYTVQWTTLSCGDVGACHSRERWWALCHRPIGDTKDMRLQPPAHVYNSVPECVHELLRRCDVKARQGSTSWTPELPAFRVYHGIPSRLDEDNRQRCAVIGNTVSPPVARLAFETLLGLQYLADPDAHTIKKVACKQTIRETEQLAREREDELPLNWCSEVLVNDGKVRVVYWSPCGKMYKTFNAAKSASM